jgi:hypothetical protein
LTSTQERTMLEPDTLENFSKNSKLRLLTLLHEVTIDKGNFHLFVKTAYDLFPPNTTWSEIASALGVTPATLQRLITKPVALWHNLPESEVNYDSFKRSFMDYLFKSSQP